MELEIRELCKTYGKNGKRALDGVSAVLTPGGLRHFGAQRGGKIHPYEYYHGQSDPGQRPGPL